MLTELFIYLQVQCQITLKETIHEEEFTIYMYKGPYTLSVFLVQVYCTRKLSFNLMVFTAENDQFSYCTRETDK